MTSSPRKISRPPPDARSHYAARIGRVIAYIDRNLDGDLSLQTLSRIANFSPWHFHRQFSEYTGLTVGRLVRLLRLKRASTRLAMNPELNVTDVALESGFDNPESFSRAFRQVLDQSPSEFRRSPRWRSWPMGSVFKDFKELNMNTIVELVDFPATKVAAIEYQGPEHEAYSGTMKLIEWRRRNGVRYDQDRTFGVHYSNPETTRPEDYRLDICVSYEPEVVPNEQGVVGKVIPGGRCARIRHLGSRDHMAEAEYLYREWLPASAEEVRDYPMFFHYVNVGPDVKDEDMVTDIYLPID